MNELYTAMDKLLIAEDNVNSLVKILELIFSCTEEERAASAPAIMNITSAVLKEAAENQRAAAEILDEYLAVNSKK